GGPCRGGGGRSHRRRALLAAGPAGAHVGQGGARPRRRGTEGCRGHHRRVAFPAPGTPHRSRVRGREPPRGGGGAGGCGSGPARVRRRALPQGCPAGPRRRGIPPRHRARDHRSRLMLTPATLDRVVTAALDEDAPWGDLTSAAFLPAEAVAGADLVAREDGVFSGGEVFAAAFRLTDPAIRVELLVEDGAFFRGGEPLARVSGPARAILTAERV